MALPAFAIPLIAAAAPIVLDKVFGGPSGAERTQQANASAVSSAEAERIRKQLEFFERLQELSKNPSAMQAILEATGGKGFQLPRNLSDARAGSDQLGNILGAIDFDSMNERDLLLQLATGIPTSSPLTGLGSAQAFDRQGERETGIGDIASLISELLNRPKTTTGVSGGIPLPLPPQLGGTTGSGTPLGFGL